MKYAWLVLGVFAARFCTYAIAFPKIDGDLFWQRWLGRTILLRHAIPRSIGSETFSAPGAAWTPQEWAFSLVAARATDGIFWTAFASGVALAALAALTLAAYHAVRRGASPRAVALCTALAGVALFASFGVRVQVVAWPLLVAFLLLMELEGPAALWAIAVAALWSNVHASAIVAPIFAAVATVGTALDERAFNGRVRRMVVLTLGSAAAICLNPFGWDLPRYSIMLFSSPIRLQIDEWRQTDLAQTSFAFGALPLLVFALLFLAGSGRRRFRDLAIVALATFLLFSAARNIAIFGLIVTPYVASALTRGSRVFARERTAPDARAERIARVAMPSIAFAIAIVVAAALVRDSDVKKERLGSQAIASLARLHGERRLYCADFAWCSLALESPRVRVFIDGRADPYPPDVWLDLDRIAAVRHDWRDALHRYDIDTILARRYSPLDQALDSTDAWRVTYRDEDFVVWIRSLRRTGETARSVELASPT